MLILTRRLGEKIIINDDIVITILNFNGKFQVRIGIEAPDDVTIHREEIYQKIQAETAHLIKVAEPIREARLRFEASKPVKEPRPQLTLKNSR